MCMRGVVIHGSAHYGAKSQKTNQGIEYEKFVAHCVNDLYIKIAKKPPSKHLHVVHL